MGYLMQWMMCLKHFISMCLFRSSPANLPASQACLAMTITAYYAVGLALLIEQRSALQIFLHVAIDVLILALICYLVLRFMGKPQRFLQTLTALIGVGLIISIVASPLYFQTSEADLQAGSSPLILQLNLAVLIWNLAAISLIFKRSFEIQTILAGFISFNYYLLYELILVSTL